MTRFKLNGVAFPKDPIKKEFKRQIVTVRGDRREVYSGYILLECELQHMTYDELDFFKARFYSGTFYVLTAPSLDWRTMRDYTGTIIKDVREFEDSVEGFVFDVRVTFEIPA